MKIALVFFFFIDLVLRFFFLTSFDLYEDLLKFHYFCDFFRRLTHFSMDFFGGDFFFKTYFLMFLIAKTDFFSKVSELQIN